MSHSVAFAISLGFLWLLSAIVQYISTGNLYVLLLLLLASLFFFLKALHLYLKRSKKRSRVSEETPSTLPEK